MLRAVSSGRGGGHVLESLDIGTAYINGATISKTFGLELSEDACEDHDLPSGEQDLLVKLSARFHDVDEALSCETWLQWADVESGTRTSSQTESKVSLEEFSSGEDSDSTLEDDYDEMLHFVQNLQDEQVVFSRTGGRQFLKISVRVHLAEDERSSAYLYLKEISGTLVISSRLVGSSSSSEQELLVPFVVQVGLSTFECDVSQVLFSDCVVQGTYYRDFTVWNRSEIPLLFRIPHLEQMQGSSRVVNSISCAKGMLGISEYDSRKKLRLSRGVKVAGFSHIRLRLSYRPEAVGDHDFKFFIFNANGSGPKQTVQMTVHAHVSLLDESQTRVLEVYNVSKDKHKVRTIVSRLDFGDCFVEDITTRRVQLFNKGMTDLSLNLSSKGHASADPSAQEIYFALWHRLKPTTSEVAEEEEDPESQDEMDGDAVDDGEGRDTRVQQSKLRRNVSAEAKLTRVSSIVIPAKKTVELLIQYIPSACNNIDDERVMQQASPKLSRREFMLLFKSDTFVHTLHAQSRVCLSVVMVDKEVLNFHDCNIGTKKSQRLSLHNYSDLPTIMKVRSRSKVVSVFLEDSARTKLTGREQTEGEYDVMLGHVILNGRFVIKSRQTQNLMVFFEPRKVNANYVRDIAFENTNRRVNNKFYVRVMASNMDPHHIIYHSLFYKFTPVHFASSSTNIDGTKRETDVVKDLSFVDKDLQNEPALDFGSITENSPSLRCLELENVTDKPVSLQLNVSRVDEMDLYIENESRNGQLGPLASSKEDLYHNPIAKTSSLSRSQPFLNRRRSQSISIVTATVSSGVSPMQPLGSSPPTLSTRPFETALLSPGPGGSETSANGWGLEALALAFHGPRFLTYSGMSSLEEETVVMQTAERIKRLEAAVESGVLVPIKGKTIVLRARSKLIVGLVLNSKPTDGNGKLRNFGGSISVRLLDLDEEAKEELRDVHRWGFRSEYSTMNEKQEPDFENVPDRAIPMRARVAKSIMSFTQRHFNFGVMRLPVNHRLRRTLILNNESAVPLLYEITTTRSIASSFINLFTNRIGMIPAFGLKKVEFEFVPTLPGNVRETLTIVNIANKAASKSVIVKAQVVRPWRFSIVNTKNYDSAAELFAHLHTLNLAEMQQLVSAKVAPCLVFTRGSTPQLAVKNIQERTRVYMLRWAGKGSGAALKDVVPEFKFTIEGTAETEISPEVEDQIEQLEHKLRIATRKNNVKKVASLTKKLAALRAESLQQVKRLPVLLMNKDEWCTECSLSLEGGDLVHIKMQVRLRAGNDRILLQLAESTTDCDLWYSSFELFDSKHRDVIKHIGVMCPVKRYQRVRPTVQTITAAPRQQNAGETTPSPVRTPDLVPRSQHSPIAITPTFSQQAVASRKAVEIISVHPKTIDFGVVLCEAPEARRTFKVQNQSTTSRVKFHIKSSSALTLDNSSGILAPQELLTVTITAKFNRGGRESFVLALKADQLDVDPNQQPHQAAVNILVQVNVLFVQFMDLDPDLSGAPHLLDLGYCYSTSFSSGDQSNSGVARKLQFRIRNVFKEPLLISAESNLKRQVLICRDASLSEGVRNVLIARHQVVDLWVAVKPRLLRDARNGACRVLTGGIRVHGASVASKESFQTTLKFQAVVGMSLMRVSEGCLDFGSVVPDHPQTQSFQVVNLTKKMPLVFRVSVGLDVHAVARYGSVRVDEAAHEVKADGVDTVPVTLDVTAVHVKGYRTVPLVLSNETVLTKSMELQDRQTVLVRYLVADSPGQVGPFHRVELTTTCIVPVEVESEAKADVKDGALKEFVVTLAGEGILGFTNPSDSTSMTLFPVSDTKYDLVCSWMRPTKVVSFPQLEQSKGLMKLCGDGIVVGPNESAELTIGIRSGARMSLSGPLVASPTPLGMLGFASVDPMEDVNAVVLDDCVKAVYAIEGSLRISRFVCPQSAIDVGKIGAVNNWKDKALSIEVYSEEGQGFYDSSPFELDISLDANHAPGMLIRAKHEREVVSASRPSVIHVLTRLKVTVTISFDKLHRYGDNERFSLKVNLRNRSNEANRAEIMVRGVIVARVVEFIMDDKLPDLSIDDDDEEELVADPGNSLRLPPLSYPNDLSTHPLKCNAWFKMQNAFDTPIQCRLELLEKLQFRHLIDISLLSRITNRKIPRNQVSLAVDESFDVRTVIQLKANVALPSDLQLNKYYQVATILVTAHCGQAGEQSSRAVTVYGKLTRGQHFSLSCRRLTFFMVDVEPKQQTIAKAVGPDEEEESSEEGPDVTEISKPSTKVSARKTLEVGTEEQSFKINNLSNSMSLTFGVSVTSVYHKGLNLLLRTEDDEEVITDTICPSVHPQTGTVAPGSYKTIRVGLCNYTDFVAKFSLDEREMLVDAEVMQVVINDDMGNKETIEVVLTGEDRRGLGPDPVVPDLQLSPEHRPQGLAGLVRQDSKSTLSDVYNDSGNSQDDGDDGVRSQDSGKDRSTRMPLPVVESKKLPELVMRGCTPVAGSTSRFVLDLGQRSLGTKDIDWVVSLSAMFHDLSRSDSLSFKLYTVDKADGQWLRLSQNGGKLTSSQQRKLNVTVNFSALTLGTFSTFLIVENTSNPSDVLVTRILMQVVSSAPYLPDPSALPVLSQRLTQNALFSLLVAGRSSVFIHDAASGSTNAEVNGFAAQGVSLNLGTLVPGCWSGSYSFVVANNTGIPLPFLLSHSDMQGGELKFSLELHSLTDVRRVLVAPFSQTRVYIFVRVSQPLVMTSVHVSCELIRDHVQTIPVEARCAAKPVLQFTQQTSGEEMAVVSKNLEVHFHVLLDKPDLDLNKYETVKLLNTSDSEMRICIIGTAKYFNYVLLDAAGFPVQITPATSTFPFDSFTLLPFTHAVFRINVSARVVAKMPESPSGSRYFEGHLLLCNYSWGRFAENKRLVLRLTLGSGEVGLHRGMNDEYHLEQRIVQFLSVFHGFWSDLAQVARKYGNPGTKGDVGEKETLKAQVVESCFEQILEMLEGVSPKGTGKAQTERLRRLSLRHCMIQFALQLLVESLVHSLTTQFNSYSVQRLVCLLFSVTLRHELFASCVNEVSFKPKPALQDYFKHWLLQLEAVLSAVPYEEHSLENIRQLHRKLKRRFQKF